MKQHLIAGITFGLLAISHSAWAGRPLATDEAGTAEASTCQVESWIEHASGENALVIAPACGIARDMELDADYTPPGSRDVLRAAGGLAFKWVPQAWRIDAPAGGRWWLVMGSSGVDLTASREADAGSGTLWSLGFGWYGLSL